MASPAILPMGTLVQGNTWDGVPIIVVTKNGSPPSTTVVTARMQFRKTPESQPKVTLTNSDGITINDATNWNLTIPPRNLDALTPGDWIADLELTDSDDTVKTWMRGELNVASTVTRTPYRNNS